MRTDWIMTFPYQMSLRSLFQYLPTHLITAAFDAFMQLMPFAYMQSVTDLPLLIERLLDLSSVLVFDSFVP